MNAMIAIQSPDRLPALVRLAADRLANAVSAAEVLDARDLAGLAYDAAKSAGRFVKAKAAHDDLIAKVHRAQADALEIEAQAKRRLADEYDEAQERGEVGQQTGRPKVVPDGNDIPSAADLGLSRKGIHEARLVRDAEEAEPGIVAKTTARMLDDGDEPTRTALRRELIEILSKPPARPRAPSHRNPNYDPDPALNDAIKFEPRCTELADAFDRRGPRVLDLIENEAVIQNHTVPAIRRCHAALSAILEANDAR